MTLQHVVLMHFPDDLSEEDERWAFDQVSQWPKLIGDFRALRFGKDLTGQRTAGYQYLLYEEFDDLAALHRYQQHPVHQEFAAWIKERNVEVIAFDYEIDGTTDFLPAT